MVFLDVCRAVYDYAPQSEEELEIKEGDLLFVLEKSSEDPWWKCKKKAASEDEDEPEGLVPDNYVEAAKPLYQAKALYDYTKQTDEELSFKEETRLEVYDDTDPDWTLVGHLGEYGFAPAIYIEDAATAASSAAAIPTLPAAAVASPPRQQRALAPPPSFSRPPAIDDGPIPGEADYPDPGLGPSPSPDPPAANPAAGLARIIAQRTGGTQPSPTADRGLASPPLPSRTQYTPEESEEEGPPPRMPQRPQSQAIPSPPRQQYAAPRSAEPPLPMRSPLVDRAVNNSYDDAPRSPGGFHLYNVHEMISHMGKNKKMPTTLGVNVGKGVIMISPEKSKDGPSHEWTAEKLTHYSIEGKHVFVELVRPSKSVDFHAGAKDTAQEIVAQLGELAGAARAEGLREVLQASAGTGSSGMKKGQMLYEFMAQSQDEVTVAVGDEVYIIDDVKSDEWWMVRRLKNGKEGVVPSSYVEVTGSVPRAQDSIAGLTDARSTVEQNRLEEERLAKQAAKSGQSRDSPIPERASSLAGEQRRSSTRGASDKRASKDTATKSKPNQSRLRTWTDRSGTFKVEAEFIGLRDAKIHLHKVNGVKIAVPVNKMAVEDLEYVERATGLSLDDDKPLADVKRRNTQKNGNESGRATTAASANGSRGGAGASVQPSTEETEQWFNFFLGCGVNPQICERYASAFARDQMGPEVLPDVNAQLLRTLGLKEGDILRVMKTLDAKYNRQTSATSGALSSPSAQDDDRIEPVNGGMFSGPSGTLRNNTRKGRPAPAVQTNDVVDEAAFKQKTESPRQPQRPGSAKAAGGFDDDAWDVKPARTQAQQASAVLGPEAAPARPAEQPQPQPPQPKLNDDLALLAMPLQPTPTGAAPPPQQYAQPTGPPPQQAQAPPQAPPLPQGPQGADQAIFDKIASLKPQPTAAPRSRPLPPAQVQSLGLAPPPRAASAPGFNPQQPGGGFGPPPLQPQLTGYQQPMQQMQQPMGMQQPMQTGYAGFQPPQQTGLQAVQQNYPALQPQPTGMAFQPQSSFGQAAAVQHYGGAPQQMGVQPTGFGQQQPQQGGFQQPQQTGFQQPQQPGFQQPQPPGFQQPQPTGYGQPNYQQQIANGAANGSPFADSHGQAFQPMPSGLSNSFAPQQTGYMPQQQQPPTFNMSQPTGMNGGYGQQPPQVPQLPPQQTGGVFGPSQAVGLGAPAAPLIAQRTGPAPPIRFGVPAGAKPLIAQPTGRANLAKATPQNPFGF